jgi:glycine amidinotransferase
MLSKNEWDPLKKVIVGVADDATIPILDISLRTINYADVIDETSIPRGRYPQQVIDETNEDLDVFCNFLTKEGVEVVRVDKSVTPNYYNYCPRDSVLVYDNLILATPQPLRARHNEYLAMDKYFQEAQNLGARYIVKHADKTDALYNLNCLGDRDILALTNMEPCFDAANILRDNDNLYYLVSNSGNEAGAEYLQSLVGKDKKVWPIRDLYSFMHIDSTIALLREGLMLLNPSRVKSKDQLPKPLRNWDAIWAAEPENIGHFPGYCNASPWLNVNLLSINPNLVAMLEGQNNLRRQLEKYSIDCAMLPGRHHRTLGGGFHCVALDLERN